MTKNEVATVGGTSLSNLAAGLKRTKSRMPSVGGKSFMKFGKDGEWTAGQGGDALNGRAAVLNVETLKAGYSCWTNYPDDAKKKNELLGEEMKFIAHGDVDPEDLPDLGWKWKQQYSIEGRMLTGDKQEFSYSTSSVGGIQAMDGLYEAILERIEDGEAEFLYPVVQLENDHYPHPQWGKTYVPILEIVGWANVDGELEEELDVEEEEPAPKAKTKAKAKTKPRARREEIEQEEPEQEEPEQEEAEEEEPEPPVRRRRRRG